MSAIDDYGCDVDGCQRVAAEMIETDDGDRVLLCARHHAEAEADAVTLASGRLLMCDTAWTWFLVPEPMEERR